MSMKNGRKPKGVTQMNIGKATMNSGTANATKRTALAVAMAASMICHAAYSNAADVKLCHMVTVYEADSWISGHVFASVPEAMTYAAKHAGKSIVAVIQFNIDCAGE